MLPTCTGDQRDRLLYDDQRPGLLCRAAAPACMSVRVRSALSRLRYKDHWTQPRLHRRSSMNSVWESGEGSIQEPSGSSGQLGRTSIDPEPVRVSGLGMNEQPPSRLFHRVCLLAKRRDVADHRGLLLVDAPEMSTRTAVVREVRKLACVRQVDGRVLVASRTMWDRRHRREGDLHLRQRRGAQLVRKWRDVLDQLLGLLVHAPDVAARATVIVSARGFAQERQKPDQITVARWTLRDRRHGKTLRDPSATSERLGPDAPSGHHCAGLQ